MILSPTSLDTVGTSGLRAWGHARSPRSVYLLRFDTAHAQIYANERCVEAE